MRNRIQLILGYGALFGLLYFVPNWLTISRAEMLPLFPFERDIPFYPDTVWIYLSLYLFLALATFQERDTQKLLHFLRSLLASLVIGASFFIIFPTKYPRPSVIPRALIPGTHFATMVSHFIDKPSNCFPSLHVSSCLMSLFLIRLSRPRWFPLCCVWFLLISLSTLTFKQHYFIDLGGGLGLGLFGISFFLKLQKNLESQNTSEPQTLGKV